MNKKTIYLLSTIFTILIGYGCKNTPLNVDTSRIPLELVHLNRFEKDFFMLTAINIQQQIEELQKTHPGFASLFINNIVCPNGIKDSACIPEIIKFISEKDMKEAYAATVVIFNNDEIAKMEYDIAKLLQYYQYYFPNIKSPLFFTMMSGFNYSIAFVDSSKENNQTGYGIGLEMYLGSKNKFYNMLRIPEYKQASMRKEFITRDIAKAILLQRFENKSTSGTLLSEMIYQGKIHYLINALMPPEHDSLIIGFSQKQLDWCVSHEKDMWAHLIENKFLYSNEKETIAKFTGDGPFTTGFVKESPARAGVWIGWNIVKKYMEQTPKTHLTELMNEQDAQIILSKSKYKP